MKTKPQLNPTIPGRKLEDGLYKFANGEWIWIHEGILYLSATLLHPVVALTCGQPLRIVEDESGKIRFFLRAAHLMAVIPHQAQLIRAVAVHHQVNL